MNTIIENGKITGTMLGKEDHGIMTFWLFVEFDSGVCGYGAVSYTHLIGLLYSLGVPQLHHPASSVLSQTYLLLFLTDRQIKKCFVETERLISCATPHGLIRETKQNAQCILASYFPSILA